jgi:hypothetical protein
MIVDAKKSVQNVEDVIRGNITMKPADPNRIAYGMRIATLNMPSYGFRAHFIIASCSLEQFPTVVAVQ